MTRFKSILIVAVSSIAIIGGVYWVGNTAYDDGVKAGISAVVHQCAQTHTTIYNGETGEVMVCDGSTLTEGQKSSGNGLSGPPRATEPPAGDPGIYEEPKEQRV